MIKHDASTVGLLEMENFDRFSFILSQMKKVHFWLSVQLIVRTDISIYNAVILQCVK